MQHYLQTYGYFAVAVWAAIGGEEGVIVSALLAAAGQLSLPWVIVASALGGSFGDQIYFYLARSQGTRILQRSARIRAVYPTAEKLVTRYGARVVLASRFLVGLRIATSAACGLFRMAPSRYTILNLVSAFIWASFYGLLAYHVGPAIRRLVPGPRSPVFWIVLLLLGVTAYGVRMWVRRKVARH